jgi:hypothetical protein
MHTPSLFDRGRATDRKFGLLYPTCIPLLSLFRLQGTGYRGQTCVREPGEFGANLLERVQKYTQVRSLRRQGLKP